MVGRLFGGDLRGFNDLVECGGVRDCDFAEHLAVQVYIGFPEIADERAVANASLFAGGGYSCNPEPPEIAFPGLAVASGHNARAEDFFDGGAIPARTGAIKTSGGLEDLLVFLMASCAFAYAWHDASPVFCGQRALFREVPAGWFVSRSGRPKGLPRGPAIGVIYSFI